MAVGEQEVECVDFGVRQKLPELHDLYTPPLPHRQTTIISNMQIIAISQGC